MMRNRHHRLLSRDYGHLWDVVATTLAVAAGVLVQAAGAAAAAGRCEDLATCSQNDYSPQFLTYVDQVLLDLVRVHNFAFWTEGQWYNMTLKSDSQNLFSLFYDKPGAIQVTTDPTGVYGKLYL